MATFTPAPIVGSAPLLSTTIPRMYMGKKYSGGVDVHSTQYLGATGACPDTGAGQCRPHGVLARLGRGVSVGLSGCEGRESGTWSSVAAGTPWSNLVAPARHVHPAGATRAWRDACWS